VLIIQLHRKRIPFAIIVSNEICGRVYTILYKDRYLVCVNLEKSEIRWFCDNRYLFNKVIENKLGEVYEYKKFRKKMSPALKHNFLVRNAIIKSGFI